MRLDDSIDKFAYYIDSIRKEDMFYPCFDIDMSELDEDEVVEKALEIIHDELGI